MKKIGILGTGSVGTTIATKLIDLGYEVKIGSRSATNDKAIAWASKHGGKASHGTFDDAAAFGDAIFLCVKGEHAPDVVKLIAAKNLDGKIVIDLTNPLDFSQGMPPALIPSLSNYNSVGEELQRLLPRARVVKTLNIVTAEVMVDATKAGGDATMFVSGNDDDAKAQVKNLLQQFYWHDVIDLGDITTARGLEMMLPMWLRLWKATGTHLLAFKIVRPA